MELPSDRYDVCRLSHGAPRHHVALISSRFTMPRRRLFLGKARLFGDRIELTGWRLTGRYKRCISLDEIAGLESFAHEKKAHLTIFLENDEVMILFMRDAFLWRALFENWVNYDVLPSAKLAGDFEAATAISG